MEPVSFSEIFDEVKSIVEALGLEELANGQHNARPILPLSIPQLPDAVKQLPQSATSLPAALSVLKTHIYPYLNSSSLSPRYYGFVTGGATPAALAADILASIYDQNVQVHLPREYIATTVEVAALNMLVDLFNLPASGWSIGGEGNGGGTFTTGATASNILGLALGREFVLGKAAERKTGEWKSVGQDGILEVAAAAGIKKVKVLSTLPHSSIAKAASVVGLGRDSVELVAGEGLAPWDIDLQSFQAMVDSARNEGTALILAISAGEVNTGRFATHSLETMTKLRQICDKNGIWIHVDGAFGLFARVLMGSDASTEYESVIAGGQGLELADSITGDGHKMLNVPYDCGFFFTRHKTLTEQVFMNGNAAYLTGGTGEDSIQSPLNIGIENSRRFRALPVFATLSTYGRQGYVTMVKKQVNLARQVVAWLWDQTSYELLPAREDKDATIAETFIIVIFRARDPLVNEKLVQKINSTGTMYVSGTKWDGKPAARIAISNWRTDPQRDLNIIIDTLCKVLQ